MRTKTLLKLAFIALLTFQLAFAGSDSYDGKDSNKASSKKKHPPHPSSGELSPTNPRTMVKAPSARGSLERLPSKTIKMITAELAITILTDIQIPDNLSNKQQFKKSFQDLRTALRKEKNPSEEFMKFFPDPQIKELVLNELSPETIKRLMPAFPNTVGTLILSGKNLGAEAAKELALYLPPELRWLSLNDNNIGSEGMEALAEKLSARLEVLYLADNNLGDKGTKALAKHLPAVIKELFLSGNNIGYKGAKALAKHFPTTLLRLFLDFNNIGDKGMKAVAQQFPPRLLWLCLDKNNIGDDGTKALAEKLPTTLVRLFLKYNEIGDEGLSALLAAIPKTDLEYLTISVSETSPLREQFNNLRNRHGKQVMVSFFD